MRIIIINEIKGNVVRPALRRRPVTVCKLQLAGDTRLLWQFSMLKHATHTRVHIHYARNQSHASILAPHMLRDIALAHACLLTAGGRTTSRASRRNRSIRISQRDVCQ